MKKLLLTISFLTLLSSTLMAKTEIITEEVCNALSGCRIEMTTGACIGCVTITRTVVTKDFNNVSKIVKIRGTHFSNRIDSKKLVASSDIVSEDGRTVARCTVGCLSASAAIRGTMFEGKYWKLSFK